MKNIFTLFLVVVWINSVAQSSIEPIKDKANPHLTIGYKLRDETTNKANTFLINDNNPFINKVFPLDTNQHDWQILQKQGSFMYDIGGAKLNEISPILSTSIPDDSIAKYRFSRAGTYCNHQIFRNYLILNYTLAVYAFKEHNRKVAEVVSLSSKLTIINNAGKVIFDISDRELGIGDVVISDNKNYLTIYGVDYPIGKARSSYRVYDLLSKKLAKVYVIPDALSHFQILSKDNVFIYALEGKSGIDRILLFDAANGQLYQKDVGRSKNLTLISFTDGTIRLTEESTEEDGSQINSLELRITDFGKVR